MAPSESRLQVSAQPFMPTTSQPLLVTYTGPPPAALPPPGFLYPLSVSLPPPPPGFPGASLGCWGFPLPQGPCVGMPGSFMHPCWPQQPTPMGAAPPAIQCAPQPQPQPQPQPPGLTAAPKAGRHRRSHFARSRTAPGARPLPRLDLPPRMQRAACPAAAANPPSHGAKLEPANEPSPRSVLVGTSPPDSPSVLPISLPYPELRSPSAPASAPSSLSVPAAGSQPVVPRPPPRRPRAPPRFRQVAGGATRRSEPKPRLGFDPSSSRTSLMIRNIPNDLRRTKLMEILDHHCHVENDKITPGCVRSEYDFLYLSMDFRSGANLGYAFVNLTTPEAARRLHDYLHGRRWNVIGSRKTCEVDHAYIQGREKLVKNFSDSCFDCDDEEFLPAVWFEQARDGTRTPSPHLVGRMLRRS